ncbi:MAG: sugar ABC transporter permease [Chloroflexota bacterium]
MKQTRRIRSLFSVLLVTAIALGLRLRAVARLPIDYDEDDYLAAGQRYAQAIRQGDWQAVIDYEYNYEHPPLTKLIYGLVILPLPEAPLLLEGSSTLPPASRLPEPHFHNTRLSSAIFGTLEALALSLLNPLAGFFLAIHTWQIKYTSQIMLEPLPALTSLLAVMCYAKWKRKKNESRAGPAVAWLWSSALFLGVTAASKFTYCVVGIAILVDWAWEIFEARNQSPEFEGQISPAKARTGSQWQRIWALLQPFAVVLLWGFVSLAVFVAFNPRLWNDPLPRLAQALLYHGDYAQSEHVRSAGFPAWQPLVWLAGPVPWHPGVFLFSLDLFISILVMVGLRRLWERRRVYALWLGTALIVLLLWPTKWPQYILILTAPLSLAAADGFGAVVLDPLMRWIQRRRQVQLEKPTAQAEGKLARRLAWRDARRALPWLLPGAIGLSLIALFPILYQGAMALTDFNAISMRDGIQGGIWRAVWNGLTGQEDPVAFNPFQGTRANTVHYAGPAILLALIGGAAPDILVFNVLWTLLSVGLQTILGVLAALMLDRQGVRLSRFWRAIFILPWAIPEFVGALVWFRILEPRYGWLAIAQQVPAGVNLPNWLENPNTTLLYLLVAATWYGFPFVMLAATAGLKLIPHEVYDAAAIDGADGLSRFRFVTGPLLFPLLAPAIIIRAIFAFNQFYLFYTMRVNYPTLTFATISYFYFSPGFGGQFAVSAAINLFTLLVLIGLILWFSRVSRAAEGVTYA